jgi:ATP phosphoribosyltransferase
MTFRMAFAKGRGAAECMRLLEGRGILISPAFRDGKLTVYSAPEVDLLCVIVRGRDISQLLEQGHVDAAIGSNLIFAEYGSKDMYAAASLDIGACRLSLITQDEKPKGKFRTICTRYPNLTTKGLNGLKSDVRILQWSGCVESALFLGLCDAITDIIETGWTLKMLSLREDEVLSKFNHGVWLRRSDRHLCIKKLETLMPSVAWEAEPPQTPGGAVSRNLF